MSLVLLGGGGGAEDGLASFGWVLIIVLCLPVPRPGPVTAIKDEEENLLTESVPFS